MADAAPVRVMVVDDHPLIRLGLSRFIEAQEDLSVVAEADGYGEALRQLAAARPDLVTMDLSIRGGDGVELIRRIRDEAPAVRILVVSMFDDVIRARRAFEAGARGYINKEEPPERVIDAIRTVLAGEIYLHPRMRGEALPPPGAGGHAQRRFIPPELLSARELQVFTLIGRGVSVAAIARELQLSRKTIETHLERIKTKLSLRTGTELLQFAFRWNLEQGAMGRDAEGNPGDPPTG